MPSCVERGDAVGRAGRRGGLGASEEAGRGAWKHVLSRRYHAAPSRATAQAGPHERVTNDTLRCSSATSSGRCVLVGRRTGVGRRLRGVSGRALSTRAGAGGGAVSGTVVAGAPDASAPAAESTHAWMSSRWASASESRRAAADVVGFAAATAAGAGFGGAGGGATTPATCACNACATTIVSVHASARGAADVQRDTSLGKSGIRPGCARRVPPT